jgi:hypothetical protein
MSRRPTRREKAARDALLDAATEVASVFGEPVGGEEVVGERADVLAALYRANEDWQEAQLAACGVEE